MQTSAGSRKDRRDTVYPTAARRGTPVGASIVGVLEGTGHAMNMIIARAFGGGSGDSGEARQSAAARVLTVLPGANCGACGHASCFLTAESIASGRAPADACVVGGAETAEQVEGALLPL